VSHMESLANLATTVGLPLEETQARVVFLTGKAAEACQVMMASPGKRVGVALLVNRKKSGAMFVCECLVLCLRHPTLNFTYCIGFQRDITRDVPLRRLLAAATSDEDYATLMKSRSAALESRRAVLLGVGSENVVQYLHDKAMEVFPEQTSTMRASTFMQVQDHLSTEGVFLMSDARVAGFPIRYASQGFVEHFGFCPADIVGKKCGDVIGGSFIVSHMESLANLATTVGLPLEETQARVVFLTGKAAEACQVMMASPGKRVGVALLVNRKKSGAMFVCECLVLCLRHPTLNFTYCIGFQRDITRDVPLRRLLAAATSDEDYATLMKSRSAALESRRAVLLGVGSENVVQYLHDKAMDVFSQPSVGLSTPTNTQVEDHLSTEGIFLMGDAQTVGFPIRYASKGFEQLYGFSPSDIVGKKCGDLIGGPFILKDLDSLANCAELLGLPIPDVEARIHFLNGKAGEACRVMMTHPGRRVGVCLLVNRKKSGELFVCECIVLNLCHPSVDWSYCVGFQRDITKDIPVSSLLSAAASDELYTELLRSRCASLESRRAVLLGVGGENVVRCLHERALDVFSLEIWRTLRKELISTTEACGGKEKPCGSVKSRPTVSTETGGTATSTSSAGTWSSRSQGVRRGGMSTPVGVARSSAAPTGHSPLATPVPAAAAATGTVPGGRRRTGTAPVLSPRRTVAGSGLGERRAPHSQASPKLLRSAGNGSSMRELPRKAQAHQSSAPNVGVVALPGRSPAKASRLGSWHDHGYGSSNASSNLPWELVEQHVVVKFLRSAGLRKYAEQFIVNGFDDMPTLLDMDDEDIKDLGVPRGHALKLKRSLRNFQCLEICDVDSEGASKPEGMESVLRLNGTSNDVYSCTQESMTAVERSWERVKQFGLEAFSALLAREFFLLLAPPEAEALFSAEVCEKHWDWATGAPPSFGQHASKMRAKVFAKMTAALGSAVAGSVRSAESFFRLGTRHAGYGAKQELFDLMGLALKRALLACLGEDFTADVEAGWASVFDSLSSSMLSGLRAATPAPAPEEHDSVSGSAAAAAPTLLQNLHVWRAQLTDSALDIA